jgi:uncharacterized SAM-binding protein YcdF (DUF218 family)
MKILRRAGRVAYHLLAAIGLGVILVVFTPFVSWWAHAYSGPLEQPKGDVLILLAAAADDRGGISFSSYWRARQAVFAWQTGGFQKIVISGGGGPGIYNYLVAEGVPHEALLAEWKSRSTRENAEDAAQLIKGLPGGLPGKKVLLTSDFHMYRALRVFRKQGIDVTPMPVEDALRLTRHWYGRIPAFQTMAIESAKIIDYKLHGWM